MLILRRFLHLLAIILFFFPVTAQYMPFHPISTPFISPFTNNPAVAGSKDHSGINFISVIYKQASSQLISADRKIYENITRLCYYGRNERIQTFRHGIRHCITNNFLIHGTFGAKVCSSKQLLSFNNKKNLLMSHNPVYAVKGISPSGGSYSLPWYSLPYPSVARRAIT